VAPSFQWRTAQTCQILSVQAFRGVHESYEPLETQPGPGQYSIVEIPRGRANLASLEQGLGGRPFFRNLLLVHVQHKADFLSQRQISPVDGIGRIGIVGVEDGSKNFQLGFFGERGGSGGVVVREGGRRIAGRRKDDWRSHGEEAVAGGEERKRKVRDPGDGDSHGNRGGSYRSSGSSSRSRSSSCKKVGSEERAGGRKEQG